VTGVSQAVLRLRSLYRGFKFGLLMIAVWTLVLGAAHPFVVLFISGPAAALFFVSTTGPRAMAPISEDHADANL
jgi:hypothetical protein